MAVGRGTTISLMADWQLNRTGFHYHTDNARTAFHELSTAL